MQVKAFWQQLKRAPSEADLRQSLSERRDLRLLRGVFALLLVMVLWAAWAPVDKVVRAEGRIIPSTRAQLVQHLEGGIVRDIRVREGQSVKAGDILLSLSSSQASTDVQQGRNRVDVLKAQQARLKAEAEGAAAPAFPADLPEAQKELERAAFRERSEKIRAEQSALRQQISQRQSELAEAQNRMKNLASEVEVARKQLGVMEGLYRKGAASQLEWLDAQGRLQRLTTTQGDVSSSIPRLQAAIGEQTSRLNESTSRFRAEARAELAQISAEINRFELNITNDSDRLARNDVRAPLTGFVNKLNFNTLGGVVRPGEVVLEITPSEGPLAVEARVRPDDRARLRPGLPTRVLIGAYDYAVFGALEGEVVEVSADTLADEKGQRYYRVVIQTGQARGALANQVILPGMTARADIVAGQRSVLSYVLSPLSRFAQQALREPS
ncbi:HlyD family type I secretion periplasmic adaptor subunit [Limnohabitans sp.]|uniref:HlyD family type I secretion periplasmic adaptor subunit n=1 Tax=Limnohabitans sp. TaxID=1907725 RepID=UPI0025BEEA34|nr:HlyD family type I secretion periplasmic adaptor subunit [Limnohabitans sp.]